ncbi:hypothetical protein [Gimesia sp.]|uniref:hypothetical protein n=1 Tax=Gimesia sp. TaxID=2024833 RepID=UPI003A8CF76E
MPSLLDTSEDDLEAATVTVASVVSTRSDQSALNDFLEVITKLPGSQPDNGLNSPFFQDEWYALL